MVSAIVQAIARTEQDRSTVFNTPIDYSVAYRPRESGASRHFGFLPFFAKKPWQVVQEYIKHYTVPGALVCDPFSGSGVTLVEALVLGRRAVGTDINPVARFITRMTAIAPIDVEHLRAAYEQVQLVAREPIESLDSLPESAVLGLLQTLEYPRVVIPPTVRRGGAVTTDELHTPRQLAGLALLRDAIVRYSNDTARELLLVALANTVRYANRTYAGRGPDAPGSPYRGNANFLRRFSYSLASDRLFYEHKVWPSFERCFQGVLDAKVETNRLIGDRYEHGFALSDVPSSRIHEITGERMVDYCFTDPPYSNDIYFLDLSILWAAWLGLDITDDARAAELTVGGAHHKSRAQFEGEFASSIESIARALKDEAWFTLVYKHRDLSLWQTIVAACESAGLHYINAVWQDVKIPSTRQHESPNVNPRGDMYLNFRRMSQRRYEDIYGLAPVLELPTRANYVEHEVERLIVTYLGADIELIASGVIQQVLDSRAFRNYRDNQVGVTEDIQKVLVGPRFTTWQPTHETVQWIMAPAQHLDPSLDAIDRARYHVFDYLRKKGEVTEGDATQHVLTELAVNSGSERLSIDIPTLLRSVGSLVGPHRWRFDTGRITDYKQLRLLFQPSAADEIRRLIEHRQGSSDGSHLRVDPEGMALLRDRLREANATNKQFETQYARLRGVLQTVLLRLESNYGDTIERVMAVGEWAQDGIDLRNLPYDEVIVEIVLRSDDRPFSLYWEMAEKVFAGLQDEDILVQFRLETIANWQRASSLAQKNEREQSLGIPLLIVA